MAVWWWWWEEDGASPSPAPGPPGCPCIPSPSSCHHLLQGFVSRPPLHSPPCTRPPPTPLHPRSPPPAPTPPPAPMQAHPCTDPRPPPHPLHPPRCPRRSPAKNRNTYALQLHMSDRKNWPTMKVIRKLTMVPNAVPAARMCRGWISDTTIQGWGDGERGRGWGWAWGCGEGGGATQGWQGRLHACAAAGSQIPPPKAGGKVKG